MKIVFAGTSDARAYALNLADCGEKIIVCTATKYGASLYPKHSNIIKIYDTPMDEDEMERVIISEGIEAIIDATHPFAVNVSANIHTVSKKLKLPVTTVKRESCLPNELLRQVMVVTDYAEATEYLKATKGNILLTIGSNHMDVFTQTLPLERLVVRVLPTISSVEKCETLGLKPKQIIAMQGPFSQAMNQAMYGDYQIQYMVTKDSGKQGGVEEKIRPAIASGIKVILIERPNIGRNSD